MARGNGSLLDERGGEQQRLAAIVQRDEMSGRLNVAGKRMYSGRIDGKLAHAVGVRGDDGGATKAKVKVHMLFQCAPHKRFARTIRQRHHKYNKINAWSRLVAL